jgi:uncharacterized UPF0160 family protein
VEKIKKITKNNMSFFNKKKILVTHNDRFHTDDIFATATLSILLNDNIKVIRTREEKWFEKGDYVYDVGGEYDTSRNRFDHHQKGGAGVRENGIPYAAFGLVWKTYGEKICGSKYIAEKIDQEWIQSIDAHDNGVDIFDLKNKKVAPVTIENIFGLSRPTWKEDQDFDTAFYKLIKFAKEILTRKITKVRDEFEVESFIEAAYKDSEDKRIIILDRNYPWNDCIMKYGEPIYVIFPRKSNDTWMIGCVRKEKKTFDNRKSFPEAWAGLRDEELAKVTGVSDAIFCHNGRFLAVAKSKEGAIKLAQLALLA